MGWRGVSLPEVAIYGTASIDLVMRLVAELLGFGRSVGLLVPFLVTGRLALGLDTIGWALGWVLLWLLLFLYGPLFFPEQGETRTDWTLGLPNRLLVATAAVGVGITFESWLAIFESLANYGGIVSSPVYVPPIAALALLGATLVGHLVVRTLEPTSWTVEHVPVPTRPRERPIAPDRYLSAVVVLGAILAVVAVLFPLPELLVVAFGAGSVVASLAPLTTPSAYLFAIREDLVRGILGGALAVWQALEGLSHLVYVLTPLLWFWLFAVGTIHLLDVRAAVARTPLSLLLLLGVLGAAGLHVVLFTFRLSLRVRARARGEEQPPLVPLFLLPLGVALFVSLAVIISSGTTTPNSLSRVGFSGPLTALGLLSIGLSVVTVLRPAAFPLTGPDVDDRATAAIATALTLTSSIVAAVYDPTVPELDVRFGVGMAVFALVVSSLWWGPRLFLAQDTANDRARLEAGIKTAGTVAVIGLVVAALSVRAGLSYWPPVPRLVVGYVLSLLILTSGLNLVLYVLIYPFRLISTPA